MEPFRLVCPSCRGKLVIRDEWLLGKSIHCPRCKIVIGLPETRPAGSEPVIGRQTKPVAGYDSSALTRVDDGSLAKQVADELATHDGGLSELDDKAIASAIDAFRATEEHERQANGTALESSHFGGMSEPSAAPFDPLHDASIPPSPLDWNSPATKRSRQWLMIAMAGVAGLLLALGGLAAFIASRPVAQPTIAKQEPTAEPIPIVAPTDTKPAEPVAPLVPPKEDSTEKPAGPPAVETPPGAANKPSESATTPAEPVKPTPAEPNPTTDRPQNSPAVMPAETPPGEPPVIEPTNELPEAMKRFLGGFDLSKTPLLSDALTPQNPQEEPCERIDVEALYHPASIECPKWEAAKERTVYAMTVTEQPLDRWLVRLGQLTGVPIGWDIEQTRFTDLNATLKLSLATERTALGELLEPNLKKLGIVVGTDASEAALLRVSPESIKIKTDQVWSLDDLCPEAASEPLWRDLLARMFKPSLTRFRIQDRKIVWSGDAGSLEQAAVAAFLDQLRRAVGIEPKSNLPKEVCDPTFGLTELDARLTKADSRILVEPDSIAKILDDAARQAGVQLVFDWPVLYEHGFSFAANDTILLRGRTWPEIVRKTLDKYALVAVADSPNRIVLTTLPRQRRMWRTIVVDAQGATSKDKLIDRFRYLAPVDAEGRSMLTVEFVPPLKPGDTARWAAVRICPPNTLQLQDRDIREALALPARP